jgi:sigma-B regulation protein RsbU (phosphoserine phosphatase)
VIRHANCGHPSGFVLNSFGDVEATLESSGLPIGCFAETRVAVSPAATFPADGTLVLMTDGMLEARSPTREMFGEERVLDVVRVNHHKSAAAIVERIRATLDAYCAGVAIEDDVTAIVVRRT